MQTGQRLGPYEMLSRIGAGGMGEVWKARDTRLDRTVAIKCSAERFNDRFEREARAIAVLNHPHICTLYDIGPDYLVMEFVDGKPPRGPLPPGQALELGAQIADALHCAHSKGVVHRDLKPANILLAKSGVKLLDFGLAKIAARAAAADATISAEQPLTKDNAILGTLQYMSPEQLEGKPADARSDVFAFGLVLYELISGRPAFNAKSQASLIAAILKEEAPPLGSLAPLTPSALDRLVRKCLAKDPDARWQSAADLRDELRWIAQSGAESAPAPAPATAGHWRRGLLVAFSVIIVALLAFAAASLLSPRTPQGWIGQRLGGPEIALGPRVSPDGGTLAFQAMVGQNTQVAVMKPESGNWQTLTRKSDAGWINEISWAPDGNRLYYDRFADVPMGVYSVPALGGDEQLVLENAFAPEALPDGSLVVIKLNDERKFQVFHFWPDSGRLQALPLELGSTIGVSSVVNSTLLRASRDGRDVFVVGRKIGEGEQVLQLYVADLASGAVHKVRTDLQKDSVISALAPGVDANTVLAAVQSSELLRIVAFAKDGSPPLTLFTVTGALQYLDCGPDGSIYADQWAGSKVVLRFASERAHPEKIGFFPQSEFVPLTILPDGRVAVLLTVGDRSRLMLLSAGKQPLPLVTTNEPLAPPIAAAGPNEVAFLIGRESERFIGVASTANGRITKRIRFDKGLISSLSASPDGKTLYCAAGGIVWAIPEQGEPQRICAGDQVAMEPGGRSLLVKIIQTPTVRLQRVTLDGRAPKEIALNGPLHPAWHQPDESIGADNRMLAILASPDSWFYVPGVIDLETGRITRIPLDFFGDYFFLGWAPGGQIVAGANEFRSSVWRFRAQAPKH